MKPLTFVLILVGILGLSSLFFPADSLLLGGISLISGIGVLFILLNRSLMMRLVRWSQLNLLRSQVLIAIIQFILIPISLYGGYNLFKLGIEFSQLGYLVFGLIFLISLFQIPFFLKKKWLTLPGEFQKHRFAVLGMSVASLAILTLAGNQLPRQSPDSFVVHALINVDHALFVEEAEAELVLPQEFHSETNTSTSTLFHFTSQRGPETELGSKKEQRKLRKLYKKQNKQSKKRKRLRQILNAGIIILSVLLVILLLGVVCAGICLIALSESVGGVILGIAVVPIAIWGIYATIKMAINKSRGGNKSPDTKNES